VTSCTVCTVHEETGSTSFLVEPQNQGRQFLLVWPQNWLLRFGDSGLKITVIVSWFGPQNQAAYDFLVAPQNQWEEDGAGHASRSSDLLHLKASRASVSQFCLKTGRGVMAGGARGSIREVTWK
jgi:hypothetical protein